MSITFLNYFWAVLGTCAAFSATASLARTIKDGARCGGTKVNKMARWQWRKNKMVLLCVISAPFRKQTVREAPEPDCRSRPEAGFWMEPEPFFCPASAPNPTLDGRQKTWDRRKETRDRWQETGDKRQETWDRIQETRGMRQQTTYKR